MCSRFLSVLTALAIALPAAAGQRRELRVCADPDDLPFSNRAGEGFENRIAEILAGELDATLDYTWQRIGRGFVRTFLNTGECDVLIGVPVGAPQMLTTRPYYRSTFVFVTPRDRTLHIRTFDDRVLRTLRIGVQFGDDGYTPPGEALGRRGLVQNLVGFYGIGTEAPAIVDAVIQRQVDVAVVWGPLAGFVTHTRNAALDLTPVPERDSSGLEMAFDIAAAVRKSNLKLRGEIDRALVARRSEIEQVLATYGTVILREGRRAGVRQ